MIRRWRSRHIAQGASTPISVNFILLPIVSYIRKISKRKEELTAWMRLMASSGFPSSVLMDPKKNATATRRTRSE